MHNVIFCIGLAICATLGFASLVQAEEQATSGYDGGFFVKSADGNFKLSIGGLIQSQGEFYSDGSRPSEFLMRRARLEFEGEFNDKFSFVFEPSFKVDKVSYEEIFLMYTHSPMLKIKTGLPKEPFSLEEIIPRKHLDFAEFSMVNQFVPAEDAGIMAMGTIVDGMLDYAVGTFNGSGEHDTTPDKDFSGRLVLHPFLLSGKGRNSLEGFQIGGAFTRGRQDVSIAGNVIENECRQEAVEYSAGVRMKGDRMRTGGEAALLFGPLAVMGEYVTIKSDLELGAVQKSITNNVWYLTASYVLTGEDKTFKGVTPAKPFDPAKGQWGAWQVALRYTQLNLDSDLADFNFTVPGNSTTQIDAWTVGLNWYLNKNVRIRTDFINNTYADKVTVGGENFSKENALIMQFQINF